MTRRHTLRSALAAALALLPAAARAQNVYDDFTGTAIDQARWYRFGDLALMPQSGGSLRFNGPRDTEDFGVYSVDGLRRDFALILDFQGFASSSTRGDPGLVLTAFDAIGGPAAGSEMWIGLRATASGRLFDAEAENRGNSAGSARLSTRATAGRMRLTRSGGRISAAFLEQGRTSWVVLRTWPDFFVTDTIRFVVVAEAGDVGNVKADCDRVRYTGTRVAGSRGYGARCHLLEAVTLGFPRAGSRAFSLLAVSSPRYARAPVVFTLGAVRASVSLAAAGAPGCFVHNRPVIVLPSPVADKYGESEVRLPIPNNAFLVGKTLYLQFGLVARVNSMGVAWSNGVAMTVTR